MDILHLFVIISSCCIAYIQAENCDETKCRFYAVTTHYREIGCTPIYNDNDKCCPEQYDCSLLEKWKTNPGKCFIKHKQYRNGDKVEDQEYKGSCSTVACFCQDLGEGKIASFVCAAISCGFNEKAEGCVDAYSHNQCCPIGTTCAPKESTDPKSCNVSGEVIFHQQRVYPKQRPYSKCICDDGHLDCRPIECGIALNMQPQLVEGSVPVYGGYKDVCPYSMISPLANDAIGPAVVSHSGDTRKCKFNNLEFIIGDSLINPESTKCIDCVCAVPPMLTCVRKATKEC